LSIFYQYNHVIPVRTMVGSIAPTYFGAKCIFPYISRRRNITVMSSSVDPKPSCFWNNECEFCLSTPSHLQTYIWEVLSIFFLKKMYCLWKAATGRKKCKRN